MAIPDTGGFLLRPRPLASWAALACLAGMLGCGGPAAVQPPVNNTVSIPTVPPKTGDDEGKSFDSTGGKSSAPLPVTPRGPYSLEELDRLVATLANDDPEEKPQRKRVWF